MAAAANGADFPKATAIRDTMSLGQMRDFSKGPMAGKSERVKAKGHPNRHKNLGAFLHKPRGKK